MEDSQVQNYQRPELSKVIGKDHDFYHDLEANRRVHQIVKNQFHMEKVSPRDQEYLRHMKDSNIRFPNSSYVGSTRRRIRCNREDKNRSKVCPAIQDYLNSEAFIIPSDNGGQEKIKTLNKSSLKSNC
jgi:hypothetical protein